MNEVCKLITQLNKQITRRSLSEEGIQELLREVQVYSRNYKRMAARKKKAKKAKLSVRAIKFTLKQTKKRNEKATAKKEARQINIFDTDAPAKKAN